MKNDLRFGSVVTVVSPTKGLFRGIVLKVYPHKFLNISSTESFCLYPNCVFIRVVSSNDIKKEFNTFSGNEKWVRLCGTKDRVGYYVHGSDVIIDCIAPTKIISYRLDGIQRPATKYESGRVSSYLKRCPERSTDVVITDASDFICTLVSTSLGCEDPWVGFSFTTKEYEYYDSEKEVKRAYAKVEINRLERLI